MRLATLERAIAEAERFLKVAKAAKVADVRERARLGGRPATADATVENNPRENGAAKRASMDLTRTLADLRQGR